MTAVVLASSPFFLLFSVWIGRPEDPVTDVVRLVRLVLGLPAAAVHQVVDVAAGRLFGGEPAPPWYWMASVPVRFVPFVLGDFFLFRPDTGRVGGTGPIPLVIGVTGHRDLRPEDIEPLRAAVRNFVDELKRGHPHTPFVAMSSLAEGADRLVARVVLETGGGLVVPLPMPKALYEQDFADVEVRREFDELLDRADSWFELPILVDSSETAIAEPGAARDRQYELGGAFVALNSQILLALWDGRDSNLTGGTAAVVRFKLKGTYGVLGVDGGALDVPDNGPVYHVETPRAPAPASCRAHGCGPTPVSRSFCRQAGGCGETLQGGVRTDRHVQS